MNHRSERDFHNDLFRDFANRPRSRDVCGLFLGTVTMTRSARRLFVGNFDAELQLSRDADRSLPRAVRQVNTDLSLSWVGIAESGDCIWSPAAIEDEFLEDLRKNGLSSVQIVATETEIPAGVALCPWAWTNSLRRWAAKHHFESFAPALESVRLVNSRRFSSQLESEYGVALDWAEPIQDFEQLNMRLDALPAATDRWVLKAEFGMSARERLLGRGRELHFNDVRWIDKKLRADGILFFEPWVDRVEESGLQFTVHSEGSVSFDAVTPLLTDSWGVYRGSRFSQEAALVSDWESAIELGHRVVARAAEHGYFGPLGIDAMRYRDHRGEIRLRPIQDINARYTMGRLGAGFRRLLAAQEMGTWLHLRVPESANSPKEWFAELETRMPNGTRLIRTSPYSIDERPVRHFTVVVIASSGETLTAAETAAFRCPHNAG